MMWWTAALCSVALALIVCAVLLARSQCSLQRTRGELARLRAFHEERMRRPNVLSHELRTPLTVVRGAAELLLDESAGPLNPDQRRFVQTIAENSNQVIEMASDLLAEASLESDLFNLRLEWTEMRQLVRRCVAQLRRVHTASIRMDNHGAPLRIQVDPRLMGQAVATGGSRRPGTGLGMMITQRIVELHGGKILVDTISRKGTTVFLTLPRTWREPDREEATTGE